MKKMIGGRALYTEKDRIWIAQGMRFFAVNYDGEIVTRRYSVGSLKERLLASCRLSRQLLRQGIHHLIPLPNGDLFITAKRISYLVGSDGTVRAVFRGYAGNKPGHQGVCVTPDGIIFFAEYTLNTRRDHETRLYRSIDGGKSFQAVLKFGAAEVRHIHFVKYDPYEKCLWLGTGDLNWENRLMKSLDNGDTWTIIGKGSQNWRAIGVCFTPEALIWGTDAGSVSDQNHIIRMNRNTEQLEILSDAEGPCHGCGGFRDGRIFVSTGVEGGENEADRYARLKEIAGDSVKTIIKVKKDLFPLIFQYGVIRFPGGTENTDRVVFTMYGLRGNGEMVYIEE